MLRKSDPAFAEKIRHVRDPKARMQVVWNFCKSKMTCEPDEPKDDADDNEEPKRGHGGCGAAQPQIRKEGLKLFVQYKRSKDDDEVCIVRSCCHIVILTFGCRRPKACNQTSVCFLLTKSTLH